MPHPLPLSNNKLLPLEKALGFILGLLCDARKLTHVSYLRRDPLVPELLGITQVASQSALTRFFQGFTSTGDNLRCFRPLWHWSMNRLPSQKEGYTLDLDSCLENFWASEAALSLAALTYNLIMLFKRHPGWQQTVTPRSLRFWLSVTAGVLSHPAGKTTIKLAVAERERDWWRRLWEKVLSPIPTAMK